MSEKLLRTLISQVLVEGRVEDMQAKFPDIDVQALAAGQPAGTNNKYLEWCVKQAAAGEQPALILALVNEFHSVRQKMDKKDLNAYKSLPELRDAIPKKEMSKSQKAAEIKKTADRVYEDDHFLVVRPNTKAASCMYGAGTRWCTAAEKGNQFKNYSSRNARFYYVIDKTKPDDPAWSKVAFVKVDNKSGVADGRTVDIYNAQDVNVGLEEFRRQMGPKWPPVEAKIEAFDKENKETWHTKLLMDLPIEQVQQMWKTFDEEEKLELLTQSPSLRPEDLMRFAKSPNNHYRKAIAERPKVPVEALQLLAKDPEASIRKAVLDRNDLDSSLLPLFANDENPNIRLALAKHKHAGPLLQSLIKDPVQAIKVAAYLNSSLDPRLFGELPSEPDDYVRRSALRQYKKFPPGVLDQLKADPNATIAQRAQELSK